MSCSTTEQASPQDLQAFTVRPFRRRSGHPRLHLSADFHQVHGKAQLIRIIGKAQRVGDFSRILCNIGPLAPADLQNIPRHQQLNPLPNGTAPHMQQLRQLKFAGELVLAGQALLHNQLRYLFRRLLRSVQAVVDNVATVHAIYRAVCKSEPVMERGFTVSGDGVQNPCNLMVRIGTSFSEVLLEAGGIPEGVKAKKLLCGGPMMGIALASLDVPICKITMR